MTLIFADTVYWVARVNPNDKHFSEAQRAYAELTNPIVVTTDSVFAEVLALLSEKKSIRSGAIELYRSLERNPNIVLVRQHSGLFNRAVDRYANQVEETASLVDCMSMEVMDDYEINQVLTADKDFELAGYSRLMRNPSEI